MSTATHEEPRGGGQRALARQPLPFKHIACCIDESEASAWALEEARRLHALGSGRLSVVHVAAEPLLYDAPMLVNIDDIRSRAAAWHAERVASAPGAQGVFLTGNPASAVCAWAEDARPDLLVVAPRHGLRERVILGSFSNYLMRHAAAPVLLARPSETGDAPPKDAPYRHIVCCVDPSEASRAALRLARRVRAAGPGALTALTAAYLPPPTDLELSAVGYPTGEELAAVAASWLRKTTRRMPEVETAVVNGYPSVVCESWVREHGADLVVVAAHRGRVARIVLGSFTSHMAHHAPCSVLVTRPAREEAE